MKNTSSSVELMYGSAAGRMLLGAVMALKLDRIAVRFLCSPLSVPMARRYAKRNGLDATSEELARCRSFRDIFARHREFDFDERPESLISPCDGWLSVFPIDSGSRFAIKGSSYGIGDFLQDESLARRFQGGSCLIFRLCVSDLHHYCYIDSGFQGENHPIPGLLHSVQPIACEKYPVYVLNRRSWCLMETDNFGSVIQCEIGALVVGGIANEKENARFSKGEEKGHFELSGSTIVLLFEPGRIEPDDGFIPAGDSEVRVRMGQRIGRKA